MRAAGNPMPDPLAPRRSHHRHSHSRPSWQPASSTPGEVSDYSTSASPEASRAGGQRPPPPPSLRRGIPLRNRRHIKHVARQHHDATAPALARLIPIHLTLPGRRGPAATATAASTGQPRRLIRGIGQPAFKAYMNRGAPFEDEYAGNCQAALDSGCGPPRLPLC
jgi:hypothetical protein